MTEISNFMLSDTLNVPYYVQIKDYLRQLASKVESDTKMPSETYLAKQFNVSRGTAKQAIMDLVYEGVLYRKQGKGTFTTKHISRDYSKLPSYSKDISKIGHTPHTKQLSFEELTNAPRVKAFFHLPEHYSIYRYKRLISDENDPLALVISYLNPIVFPNLMISDIGESLYESLEEKYHTIPTQATDTYTTAEISPNTAKLLMRPKSTIVIYSERLATLADGTPCEFVESYIRPDRFKIQIEYKSSANNTVQWSINSEQK